MSESSPIEQRLTRVERELEDLRLRYNRLRPSTNWLDDITGTFKDDPDFDEILRLGKVIRDSDESSQE